ncbi:hypothetical protein PRZ48_007645 [Zasmidium cellare]|uniref:Major facilitator superfamily (MFS) profile domain-containing protein n=1 Tax=Zasmidium cellare TaxID=395010 RepID=A0ABR0EKP2_ZASCE|nr:hypothetical protein PRZ48_007645 [Zasmidium cellare]
MAKLGAFRAYYFGFFVCLAGFLFGYDTGIVGGVLTMESYKRDFGYTDNTTVSAVMVSLQNVGAFLSALCIFPISERFGRKKTIQVAMTVFCIGVILQVIPSHSLVCFYIGRFVSGLGLGSATAVVPAYNAEQAPKEIRGKLGSGMQWLFALGVMISYWVDYGTVQGIGGSHSSEWQIPVGLQMVPAACLGLGLIPQKESIRWLAKKGRNDEAWEALTWMRADDGPEVKAEFNEIKVGIAEEMRASEGFKKRELWEPANRYRLGLAFGVFLGQQCTGMTALAYFGPQFFKLLVGSGTKNLLITGLFGAEKFITVGIYILFFSEMWNRKPTLWVSAILMSICFIIVTVVNKTTPAPVNNQTTSAGIATVAMIFITNSIYQFSWGPLPWPYAAEIFPNRIREVGTSVGVSTQWLFNFLFSLVTPYMIKSMSTYVFLFYAALDIIMAIFVWFFIKETKGRTLEEMEKIFNSRAQFDNEAVRNKSFEVESGGEDRYSDVQIAGKHADMGPK